MAKKIHSSIWLPELVTVKINQLAVILQRRGASTVKAELIEWALEQPYWKNKLKGEKDAI